MTVEAVRAGTRPRDALARGSWPIELNTRLDDTHWEIFPADHMHFIPLGAMIPVGLKNVIVAGRCVDAEPAALASVQRDGTLLCHGERYGYSGW